MRGRLRALERRCAAAPGGAPDIWQDAGDSGRADVPARRSHVAERSRARGRRARLDRRPRVACPREGDVESRRWCAAPEGIERNRDGRGRSGEPDVRATGRASVGRVRERAALAAPVACRVADTRPGHSIGIDDARARDRAHVGEVARAAGGHRRVPDRRHERAREHRDDREPSGGASADSTHGDDDGGHGRGTPPIIAESRARRIDLDHLIRAGDRRRRHPAERTRRAACR